MCLVLTTIIAQTFESIRLESSAWLQFSGLSSIDFPLSVTMMTHSGCLAAKFLVAFRVTLVLRISNIYKPGTRIRCQLGKMLGTRLILDHQLSIAVVQRQTSLSD